MSIKAYFLRKINKNWEAKHIYDSASCILVSIIKDPLIMSGVYYETQLFILVFYVTNLICIKLKFVTKSLYVSNDFAFHTVMI